MSKEKELLKNTGIIFIGKLGIRFMTFLLLPMYTWILSPEDFGKYDLVNTYVSFLAIIFGMQLGNSIFRITSMNRENKNYIKIIFSTTIVSIFFQIILYCFFIATFKNKFQIGYSFFLCTNVVAVILMNNTIGFVRGLGFNKEYSILGMIVASIGLVLNIVLLVYLRLGIKSLFISNLIAQISGVLYITFKLRLYKFFKLNFFNKKILKELYFYAIPLIPNEMSWATIRLSDRIIVSKFLPLASLGYMSIANRFSQVLLELFSIFGMSWTESVLVNYAKGLNSEFFKKIIKIAMNIFVSLAVFILLGVKIVYPYIIEKDYIVGFYLIPLYIIGVLFNIFVGLISTIYVAKGNSKTIAITSVITAIINVVVNLLFVKRIGIYVAPLSTAVAFFCLSILRYIYLDKRFKNCLPTKAILTYIIIFLLTIPFYYFSITIFSLTSMIIVFLILIYINKNECLSILTFLKNKIKNKN